MRKLGGLLIIAGLVVLIGWGLYWFFRLAFLEMPLPVKIAIAAIAVGLAILFVSLGRERYRDSKAERSKFKEVDR
ncbi:MAG: hypothetical protein ACNA7X_03620 [Dehalococcoidia bacterium]